LFAAGYIALPRRSHGVIDHSLIWPSVKRGMADGPHDTGADGTGNIRRSTARGRIDLLAEAWKAVSDKDLRG
jgi:hypothetical protein